MNTYRIADLSVSYDAVFPTLQTRSEKYSAPFDPQAINLAVTSEEIAQIRDSTPLLTDDLREYMILGRKFYEELIRFGGMMLHASAVVVDNQAFLFSAPSGTGKSTHTGLWLQKFGERAYILNDDKPALRMVGETVYTYGTPFSGKFDISRNAAVPRAGIAFVERSETNSIEPLDKKRALFELLNQTVRPQELLLYKQLLQNLDQLLPRIDVYRLHCNMNPEAATISYKAMRKGTDHEN